MKKITIYLLLNIVFLFIFIFCTEDGSNITETIPKYTSSSSSTSTTTSIEYYVDFYIGEHHKIWDTGSVGFLKSFFDYYFCIYEPVETDCNNTLCNHLFLNVSSNSSGIYLSTDSSANRVTYYDYFGFRHRDSCYTCTSSITIELWETNNIQGYFSGYLFVNGGTYKKINGTFKSFDSSSK